MCNHEDNIWRLVEYTCQEEECLVIWNTGTDSKIGALNPNQCSVGEAIVKELNRLEEENKEIKEYVECVEQANDELRTIRDRLVAQVYTGRNEELVSDLTDNLADEIKKNGELMSENNQLRIENMRLKTLLHQNYK